MALSELLEQSILLQESTCLSTVGVSEDEARLAVNRNFISIFQLSPLITANECFVDEGAILRKVFKDGNRVCAFVLREEQAVSV